MAIHYQVWLTVHSKELQQMVLFCAGKALFGRPPTLTLLRYSYLNSMDWNKLTIAARENLAADMSHSTETQDTYRWISGKHWLGFGKQQ